MGMTNKGRISFQLLLVCLVFNGALLAAFFLAGREVLTTVNAWVEPLISAEGPELPQQVRSGLENLKAYTTLLERYLAPAVFGVGGAATFLLWIVAQGIARRQAGKGLESAVAPEKSLKKSEPAEMKAADSLPADVDPKSVGAVLMLSVFQREGRLIDFLNEDLSLYEDAQIGAAVRSIHEGCRSALGETVELEPIFKDEEGASVTVSQGFDAAAVRLTGNVTGDPPFQGILRHRGWRVRRLRLPQITAHVEKERIVAPAEVEVGATD